MKTEIIKEEEKEITVDLDCGEDQILEAKDSDETIQEVLFPVEYEILIETKVMQSTRSAMQLAMQQKEM